MDFALARSIFMFICHKSNRRAELFFPIFGTKRKEKKKHREKQEGGVLNDYLRQCTVASLGKNFDVGRNLHILQKNRKS